MNNETRDTLQAFDELILVGTSTRLTIELIVKTQPMMPRVWNARIRAHNAVHMTNCWVLTYTAYII
jgi:hypothetical protein